MKTYIKAKQIVLADRVVNDGYLEIIDSQFGNTYSSVPGDANEDNTTDYSEYIVSAGLVDTHIHGYQSYDVMDNDFSGIEAISEGLLACGVTSWLPTTLTASTAQLDAVCQTIGDHAGQETGAKIRGIFLEGPFFTEKYKGAQNPKYMSDPSIDKLNHWYDLSGGLVNKIAIAPEREGVVGFITQASELGVKTALAHSDATFEEAQTAVSAGANIFVHTYNGMSGLHHRNPGMVGAALSLDHVYAEVIADGYHVHPAALKVVVKARSTDETVLVTDCMRAGGLGDGKSTLGEFEVEVKDGAARLVQDGHLAGSVLKLIESVQNMVKWHIAEPAEALRMASLVAAQSVAIDDVCGQIKVGCDADFIVVDEKIDLKASYLNGKIRFEK